MKDNYDFSKMRKVPHPLYNKGKKLDDEIIIVESDLTNEEKVIISEGREEYKKGGFIPLNLD